MNTDYAVRTHGLTKFYGQKPAVDHIDMNVKKGEIYGFIGRNGAGKSTTLKMLVGLLRPTGGRIILDGRPWQRESLSKIGSLIESPALYGNLTAEENLLVHTRLLKIPKTKITEVLETVNLKNTGKKRVSQFSMGMKQRLGIAAALLNDPELLILDEPTNGLDPFGIQELRELIISFSEKGMTVILSSHILSEVAQVADTIGIISGGKLLFQGMPDSDENLENFFTEVILKGGKNCEWTEI